MKLPVMDMPIALQPNKHVQSLLLIVSRSKRYLEDLLEQLKLTGYKRPVFQLAIN